MADTHLPPTPDDEPGRPADDGARRPDDPRGVDDALERDLDKGLAAAFGSQPPADGARDGATDDATGDAGHDDGGEQPATISPTLKPKRRATLSPSRGPETVMQRVESRIGQQSRILLRDEDSEHGASPLLGGGGRQAQSHMPSGRGNYQVLGEIARGGMGQVLKGHDTDLGRDVAMKVLLEEHADSDTILQRFVEEAQIGGQLQHPGIVPVYELGLLDDDRPYFTMKLVKGRTLAALFAERTDRRKGRRRFLGIFEQICQTMAYAHARRVMHRDLKPANIMVGAFGEVQVVDWGLAKVLLEGGVADERCARQPAPQVSIIETVRSGSTGGSQSLVGSVMGTPAYMPPEQAQGEIERLDERADVFALGGILAEILTGRPPYIGEAGKVLEEAASARQDGIRTALDACEAEAALVDLCKRCLSPNRDLRPLNAGALAREVQEFLADREERARQAELEAAEARVKAQQERKARVLTLALATTVLVAGLAGGWGWLHVQEQAAEQVAQTERRRTEVTRKVASILEDAQLLRGQQRFAEAFVALDQADSVLAATLDAPEGLDVRVATLRAEVSGAEREVNAAQAALDRDATLLETLDELQFSGSVVRNDNDRHLERIRGFEQAFADYGWDVEGTDADELAAAVLATDFPREVALAFDSWTRSIMTTRGFNDPQVKRLLQLAIATDPDPYRVELRKGLMADDRSTYERLLRSPEVRDWPPETVITFVTSVWQLGHKVDVLPLLRSCRVYYPDNAVVAALMGQALVREDQNEEALVHFQAARSARPGYTNAVFGILRLYIRADRFEEAAETFDAHHLHQPYNETAVSWLLPRLADAFIASDRYDEAVDLFERAAQRAPEAEIILNNLAWFLTTHPDPDKRRPAYAAEVARRMYALDTSPNAHNTLGVALYRNGEYREAVGHLAASMRGTGGGEPIDWLVTALCLEKMGRWDDADKWFNQAMQYGDQFPPRDTADNFLMLPGQTIPDEANQFLEEALDLFGRR